MNITTQGGIFQARKWELREVGAGCSAFMFGWAAQVHTCVSVEVRDLHRCLPLSLVTFSFLPGQRAPAIVLSLLPSHKDSRPCLFDVGAEAHTQVLLA